MIIKELNNTEYYKNMRQANFRSVITLISQNQIWIIASNWMKLIQVMILYS